MSFLDDLLRTLRAPLDFVRGKTGAVRSAEGRIRGDLQRIKRLPTEFKGELDYNKQLASDYKKRAQEAKGQVGRLRKGGGVMKGQTPDGKQKKVKMGLFSKKQRCPNCDEKLDARWELCPYCGFGAESGAPSSGGGGGAPRTQALDAYGGGGGHGGDKPRTMALDAFQGGGGGGGAGASRLVAWIIPLDGPQGGQLLELRARAIVGTAPDCDVVVKDSSISGRHAEFNAQGGIFRVNDLGSTNGTFVNEKRVQSAELVDGDTLRLGRTAFKFKST